MNKVLLPILLFSFIVLNSCTDSQESKSECMYLDFSNAKDSRVSDVFSEMETISLESTMDSYMYDVDRLIVTDEYFTVSDTRHNIYLYSKEGRFISSSANKVGDGPGEYSIITSFTFNPYTNQVEICTPDKILFYDVSFDLKSEVMLSDILQTTLEDRKFINKIYDLGEHVHGVSLSARDSGRDVLYVIDSKEKKILKELSYGEDVLAQISMQDCCFSTLQDNELTFAAPCVTPFIYRYDQKEMSLDRYAELYFGPDALKREDVDPYKDNEEKLSDFLLTCEKIIPIKVMNTGSNMTVLTRQGNRIRDMKSFFYNMEEKTYHSIDCYGEGGLQFPVFKDVKDQYVYSLVRNEQIPEIVKAAEGCKIVNSNEGTDDEEDGVTVIRYWFK